METISILNGINYKRRFNQWEINLETNIDSIIFKIENDDNIYKTSFNLSYLQTINLFSKNNSLREMINSILNYIDDNKIMIQEDGKNVKLIILQKDILNIELIIKKKNKLCEEIIDKLIKEIKKLKEKNNQLELRIQNLEKEEEKMKKEKGIINKTIINPKDFSFKSIKSINLHTKSITSLSKFPSGNIISVSSDKSIKIYDKNLNIIQNIINAHNNSINYVNIKDENNFVTCSNELNIKLWNKKINEELKEEFTLQQIISNAHDDWINKVIYSLNGNIISCSNDKTIKIWKENNNMYEFNTKLINNNSINSILLLEDKNILISSGKDGTKFWDLKNYKMITHIKEAICCHNDAINRIDKDRIIIGGDIDGIIKIISINKNKIIKEINNEFLCFGICTIEEKGIFLIGGKSKEIRIYRNDNYECIKILNDAHDDEIYGIIELKDKRIASYGYDKIIKIWSLILND